MITLRKPSKIVRIGDIPIGGKKHWALIAGPCAIESMEIARHVAKEMTQITNKLGIPYIFKGSYDKANRMSIHSERGVGIQEGLKILSEIKKEFKIPVLTDIHETYQAEIVSKHVDCIQIPAFLCRQTDLLQAAVKTGLPVNIKKGQFMAPEDMSNIAEKASSLGANGILLTERGVSFGYHNLVVDFRSIPIMAKTGLPIVMDASHCQQKPGGEGDSTGGSREFIPHITTAALALDIDALYLEVHPEPSKAISDRKTQWPLDQIAELLEFLVKKPHTPKN